MSLMTLDGRANFGNVALGGTEFGGVLDTARSFYEKAKKKYQISVSKPDPVKVFNRLFASAGTLGAARSVLYEAQKRGLPPFRLSPLFARYELRRLATNNLLLQAKVMIKTYTGKTIKVPWVQAIGPGPAVKFAGFSSGGEFGWVQIAVIAIAGVTVLASAIAGIPMALAYAWKVRTAAAANETFTKGLEVEVAEILQDPDLTSDEKAGHIRALREAALGPEVPSPGGQGLLDRLKQALGLDKFEQAVGTLILIGGTGALVYGGVKVYKGIKERRSSMALAGPRSTQVRRRTEMATGKRCVKWKSVFSPHLRKKVRRCADFAGGGSRGLGSPKGQRCVRWGYTTTKAGKRKRVCRDFAGSGGGGRGRGKGGGMGATVWQRKFGRASKKCKGLPLVRFRACVRRELRS